MASPKSTAKTAPAAPAANDSGAKAATWSKSSWRGDSFNKLHIPFDYPSERLAALKKRRRRPWKLSPARVRRRDAKPQGRAGPGGPRRSVPVPGRRLRRELQRARRGLYHGFPARFPADCRRPDHGRVSSIRSVARRSSRSAASPGSSPSHVRRHWKSRAENLAAQLSRRHHQWPRVHARLRAFPIRSGCCGPTDSRQRRSISSARSSTAVTPA